MTFVRPLLLAVGRRNQCPVPGRFVGGARHGSRAIAHAAACAGADAWRGVLVEGVERHAVGGNEAAVDNLRGFGKSGLLQCQQGEAEEGLTQENSTKRKKTRKLLARRAARVRARGI